MGNWTQALLVGIGISIIDLNAVFSAFSVTYLILAVVPISLSPPQISLSASE